MNRLNIAIVGAGRIGTRHAKHIHQLANLRAVCDIKLDRAVALTKEYGGTAYGSLDGLLAEESDLDLIAVCTPNGLHAEHTIMSLHAGVNVLCEKPMAIRVTDCERMIHAAETHNKRLFIVKQNRFNPPVQAVKKLIDTGKLGKIFEIQVNCFWNRNSEYYTDSDWKGTSSLDGGTLFTQFSHFIDLMYWFMGDIAQVTAMIKNFTHQDLIEFEDSGVACFTFSSDAIGTLHYTVNCYEKNMEGSITLFGEHGAVKIGGQYLNTLEYQRIKDCVIDELEPSGPPNEYGSYQGSMSNHDKVYENVIDVLTNQGSIYTNMLDGLKTVQIIEKIYLAAGRKL